MQEIVADLASLPQFVRSDTMDGRREIYPHFVHKWSRESRPYRPEELNLPRFVKVRGNIEALSKKRAGVGGTRSPGVETFELVASVSSFLSHAGIGTISGGVPGVDLACHLSSIEPGYAGTIAVLANPVTEGLGANGWASQLVDDAIAKTGLFLSEYDDLVPVGSHQFQERLLQRDRLISGLSDIFIAFECSVDSATVDTARRAMAQGAEVVVVHPPVVREREGTFQLAQNMQVIELDGRTMPGSKIAEQIISLFDKG